MDTATSFGEQLRRLRESAGLTQEELAERAGLTGKGIGALERGVRRHPYPHTVRALADALELSADERAALVALLPRRGSPGADPSPAPSGPPSPTARPLPPLPVQPTGLIGRERERDAARRLLETDAVRLLTFTGPGGVGKTRLAVQLATDAHGRFSRGVAFVDLAPLRDPALVLAQIGRAVGVGETSERSVPEDMARLLAGHSILLLLDNMEHLLGAATDIGELLERVPGVTILATSREPLRLRWEHEFPLLPLPVPERGRGADSAALSTVPAVALFVRYAQATLPNFVLSAANATVVAELCRRLDGLPLALELAAAWVRLLPLPTLLARLDRSLALLAGGPRDLPARQQTLRGTLDWSHDLLDPAEQILFRRLAPFVSGWTLQAAESVVVGQELPQDTLLGHLSGLVERSLVQTIAAGEVTRYRFLETVRQYAQERLAASGEAPALRARHAAWCLALAEEAEAGLTGPQQAVWLTRLEQEHDNLRAALGWSFAEGDPAIGLRIGVALGRFWQYHAHVKEGSEWLLRGLATPDLAPILRAKALAVAGWLMRVSDDLAAATALLEESLLLQRDLADPDLLSDTLDTLGDAAYFSGDHARARAIHEESLALRRGLGDRWGVAMSLNSLGWVTLAQGEHDRAATLLDEALALTRDLDDRRGMAMILGSQGLVALDRADPDAAQAVLMESLQLFYALGNPLDVILQLLGLAAAASLLGHDLRAARLYGAAERQWALADLGNLDKLFWQIYYGPPLAAARARLGEGGWAAAHAAGQALPLDEVVAEALDEAI
ncbi:MAG TPA: helix-turn-helix domain-containing protein [Thermomicrobiales bacterium]